MRMAFGRKDFLKQFGSNVEEEAPKRILKNN
jgi:hypothetical protein